MRRDIDLDELIELARDVGAFFGREMPGSVYKIGPQAPTTAGVGRRVRRDHDAHEAALRHPGSGPDERAVRSVRHAAPRAVRRRGDQDREPGGRRSGAQARQPPRAEPAADGHQLPGPERQQEVAHAEPEEPEQGKEIFRKLADTADVLVENFRPGVMERLGLGYEALSEINPRLVYCAISGFGQTGPDALKPAYDQIIQGLSGVMAVNGDERLNPLRAGFPVCDTVGGLNAAFAIMAALYHRERTGEGQFIDVAMLDSIMPLMGWVAANLLIGKQQPQLMGNDNFTAAPSGTFVTKDGYINIAANKQEQWEALTDVLGVPELKTDPRFQERDTRKKNRKALTPLLEVQAAGEDRPRSGWRRSTPGVSRRERSSASSRPSARPQIEHRGTLRDGRRPGIGDAEAVRPDGPVREDPRLRGRAATSAVGSHGHRLGYDRLSKISIDGAAYFLIASLSIPTSCADIRLSITFAADVNNTDTPSLHAAYPSAIAKWLFPSPTVPINTTFALFSKKPRRNKCLI